MSANPGKPGVKTDVRHPLLRQIAEMTAELTGSRMLIVYPEETGWGQMHGDAHTRLQPDFCKLIKSAPEGAKHCRMCHILMAVAACNGGAIMQQCHAGASVLVCPASGSTEESVAILSSCTFSSEQAWDETRKAGEKYGLDLVRLRRAYRKLPRPGKKALAFLRASMQAMSYAIQTVRQNHKLTERLEAMHTARDPRENLEAYLAETAWAKPARGPARAAGAKPLLVHVVGELVRQRPDLPLSVKELAAAARLTPNHFSTLFRAHTGSSFTAYLTDQRIRRAQKLLLNPTLNVKEIARLVGFDDPGYFTRRFRQKTRLSPGEWRNRRHGAARAARRGAPD